MSKKNVVKIFLSKKKKNDKYTIWYAYSQGNRRLVVSYKHKTRKVVVEQVNKVLDKLGLIPNWIDRS